MQTVPDHLPKAHQKHLEWSPQRLIAWGQSVGGSTGAMVEGILCVLSSRFPWFYHRFFPGMVISFSLV